MHPAPNLYCLHQPAPPPRHKSAGPPDGLAESYSHGDWTNLEASQLSGDDNGGRGGEWSEQPPVGGELSTTESAFLERSRRYHGLDGSVSGLHGDSLFGGYFDAGFRDGAGEGGDGSTIGGGGGGGGGNTATISALRDRLATVEGENAALRARARRAEEERAEEAVRGEKACKKLAKVGRGHVGTAANGGTVDHPLNGWQLSCALILQWDVNHRLRISRSSPPPVVSMACIIVCF